VHIASIAGESVGLFVPLYYVSKHGVQALARCMADLEEAIGVRVTCLMPGIVKTPLWTDHPEKLKMVKEEGSDQDTWATPEEVAQVMLACVKDNETPNVIPGSLGEKEDIKREMIKIEGGTCLE
jgi:3-hydroxybutyrate dehydrogenase